jgi:hypothetical protein
MTLKYIIKYLQLLTGNLPNKASSKYLQLRACLNFSENFS